MVREPELTCRVCGYKDPELPWGADGHTPTFELCPCCGVQHGYEDMTLVAARKYRATWLAAGAKWHSKTKPVARLIIEHQLAHVPLGWT